MLALFYLGLAIAVGDLLCRRFYRFVSIAHRWAAADTGWHPAQHMVHVSSWAGFCAYGRTFAVADLLFFVRCAWHDLLAFQKSSQSEHHCAACTGIVEVGLDHARSTVCCGVRSADRNTLCQ